MPAVTMCSDFEVQKKKVYWGPAPVGSRDSLRMMALVIRIAKQRFIRCSIITGLRGKSIKFVTPNLL